MLRMFLAFVLMPLMLVGCGKTTEQESKETADNGNAKISRMSEISSTVLSSYTVVLVSKSYVTTEQVASINSKAIDQLSISQLNDLRSLVQEFRSLAGDVIGIIDSNKTTGGDRYQMERAQTNADRVLRLISSAIAQAS